MVIVKKSFDDICQSLSEREDNILKKIPQHLLSHSLSVAVSHLKSFDPIMKLIMELENTPRICTGKGIHCHTINPEARNMVWRHYETNNVYYAISNPVLEFPLIWKVTLVTNKNIQKTFGSIHFFINKNVFPVTKLYLANKANTLDFIDIFDKIFKKYK